MADRNATRKHHFGTLKPSFPGKSTLCRVELNRLEKLNFWAPAAILWNHFLAICYPLNNNKFINNNKLINNKLIYNNKLNYNNKLISFWDVPQSAHGKLPPGPQPRETDRWGDSSLFAGSTPPPPGLRGQVLFS